MSGTASPAAGPGTDVDRLYACLRASLPGAADRLRDTLGAGWAVDVVADGPFPEVLVRGPAGRDGRRVAAEVRPVRCRAGRFHATVGVTMTPGEVQAAARRPDVEPAWIADLRAVGAALEAAAAPEGPVRLSAAAGGGRTGPARAKLEAARRHGLPPRFAKGWPDRLLGARTAPVDGADLPAFLAELGRLLASASGALAGGGRIAP